MEETIIIHVNKKRAFKLLHDMAEQDLITVIEKNVPKKSEKLSEKYRNVFSKADAKSFDKHVKKTRSEWNNI